MGLLCATLTLDEVIKVGDQVCIFWWHVFVFFKLAHCSEYSGEIRGECIFIAFFMLIEFYDPLLEKLDQSFDQSVVQNLQLTRRKARVYGHLTSPARVAPIANFAASTIRIIIFIYFLSYLLFFTRRRKGLIK